MNAKDIEQLDAEDMFEDAPGGLSKIHLGAEGVETLGNSYVTVWYQDDEVVRCQDFDQVRVHDIAEETWVIGQNVVEYSEPGSDEETRLFYPAELFPYERVVRIRPTHPSDDELPDDITLNYPGVGPKHFVHDD